MRIEKTDVNLYKQFAAWFAFNAIDPTGDYPGYCDYNFGILTVRR